MNTIPLRHYPIYSGNPDGLVCAELESFRQGLGWLGHPDEPCDDAGGGGLFFVSEF